MKTLEKEKEKIIGWWQQGVSDPETDEESIRNSLIQVTKPIFVINNNGHLAISQDGIAVLGKNPQIPSMNTPLLAYAPAIHPQQLGDPDFKQRYGLKYAYIGGAMANGITSVEMVQAFGRAGMIGFFGAAGLSIPEIERAIDRLQHQTPAFPFGINLIHSPNDYELELATVKLYLAKGIRLISASAYLDLTVPLIWYRTKGIYQDSQGQTICPNRIIAKVSRVEVARKFFSPPPDKILSILLNNNLITPQEASLAKTIPVADDLTAEADSGGHTDNRPAIALLPTIMALRDDITKKYGYIRAPRVGLGGGIATPESTAAAFAMGAAYVLTGSVNQACVEAGVPDSVRQMLAEAGQADVAMAPSADMFEMGVKVQVLKRGTMFPLKAAKLYELYCTYHSIDDIPDKERQLLERDYFRCALDQEWQQTQAFFQQRDPKQLVRAETDPKHKMALIFRSYLGRASKWAISGDPTRKIDYQIWCGPSIGAFNEWVKGSFLEKPSNRTVVTVALNLLVGASVVIRANWLKTQGIILSPELTRFYPMPLPQLMKIIEQDQ